MIKIYINYEIRRVLVCLIAIVLSTLVTVVSPLVFYINSVGFQDWPRNIEIIILTLIIIGLIITILTFFIYLQRYYPFRRFVLLIAVEFLYLFYILFSMNLYKIIIYHNNIFIEVNLSLLFLVILGIPVIHLIRNIVLYLFERQELNTRFTILKTIQDLKKGVSKKLVRRQISKNSCLSSKQRRYILKNLNELLTELEYGRYPFIIKTDHYHITKRGRILIKLFEKHRISKIDEKVDEKLDIDNLEVWTEAELQKLAKKRRYEYLLGNKK